MFTSGTLNFHRGVSAVIAAAIVGISGLALDRGYITSPRGEIAKTAMLSASDVLPAVVVLPEVVVTAPRLAMTSRQPQA